MVLHRRQAKLLHRNVRIVGAHEMHEVLVHAQSSAYVQVLFGQVHITLVESHLATRVD